eukprot:TRINITY_DN51229_c0_g1_i1.p1 TRINITY_DN51229_c0_g1~~TRINITY_DN51229_c0_g1_i1.p1  ORF type:complete len:279 (-),score=22.07 TRINITY_DN51229_c0_g1_i1:203-1039(-)
MNDFRRNRAGLPHPNVVIARRELERQEKSRLRRLSEARHVRPASATSGRCRAVSGQFRAASASFASPAPRSNSRPCSAKGSDVSAQLSKSLQHPSAVFASSHQSFSACSPESNSFATLQVTGVATPMARSSPPPPSCTADPVYRRRRCKSATGPQRRVANLCSAEVRLEEFQNKLRVGSEEEDRALREELATWYFGCRGGDETQSESLGRHTPGAGDLVNDTSSVGTSHRQRPSMLVASRRSRPAVGALEQAAAAMKPKSGHGSSARRASTADVHACV